MRRVCQVHLFPISRPLNARVEVDRGRTEPLVCHEVGAVGVDFGRATTARLTKRQPRTTVVPGFQLLHSSLEDASGTFATHPVRLLGLFALPCLIRSVPLRQVVDDSLHSMLFSELLLRLTVRLPLLKCRAPAGSPRPEHARHIGPLAPRTSGPRACWWSCDPRRVAGARAAHRYSDGEKRSIALHSGQQLHAP